MQNRTKQNKTSLKRNGKGSKRCTCRAGVVGTWDERIAMRKERSKALNTHTGSNKIRMHVNLNLAIKGL